MKRYPLCLYIDFAYVFGLIFFVFLFYFEIKNIFLTNFVIILSFSLIVYKLFLFYLDKKNDLKISKSDKKNKFLLRLGLLILTYINPLYCILQEPSLIISHEVSYLTFIIVILLSIFGFYLEYYLLILKKEKNNAY